MVVVPEACLVIAEETRIAWKAVDLVAHLANGEKRPVHRPVRAVTVVGTNLDVAVVQAAHHVHPFGGFHFHETAPRRVGIRGHARSVEEDADRIAVEAVLDEYVVVGRDQEIVSGRDAADPELNAVIEQLLLIRDVDESVRLASEDLLNGEDVADVLPREAGPEALRERDQERSTVEPDQLLKVEVQVDAQVAGL